MTDLAQIRAEVGLSMRDFATVLELKKPTYTNYEIGRRAVPPEVMAAARAYWAGMDERIAAAERRAF